MRLFRGKFSTTGISDIETEYISLLTNATNAIAFLPEGGQNRLLKITEGIVDTYKFCSVFEPNIITDFLVTTNKVIDPRLGNQSILVDFGAQNFKLSTKKSCILQALLSFEYIEGEGCDSRTCYKKGLQNAGFPVFWNTLEGRGAIPVHATKREFSR